MLILIFFCFNLYANNTFVAVQPSNFLRTDNHGNVQKVTLSEFEVSKYLITIEEWKEYLQYQNLDAEYWERSILRSLDNWDIKEINPRWPAWNISWIEAIRYCNWLSIKHSLEPYYNIEHNISYYKVIINKKANGYRLPTLAQWQFVSMLFDNSLSNEDILAQNVLSESNPSRKPKEVGSMSANSFGLYDVLGNIQEFLWDYYDENEEWKGIVKDPLGSEEFTPDPDQIFYNEPIIDQHLITKGMWTTKIDYVISFPTSYTTSKNKEFIGFRLVR